MPRAFLHCQFVLGPETGQELISVYSQCLKRMHLKSEVSEVNFTDLDLDAGDLGGALAARHGTFASSSEPCYY